MHGFKLLVSQKAPLSVWEFQDIFFIRAFIHCILWSPKARNVIVVGWGLIEMRIFLKCDVKCVTAVS